MVLFAFAKDHIIVGRLTRNQRVQRIFPSLERPIAVGKSGEFCRSVGHRGSNPVSSKLVWLLDRCGSRRRRAASLTALPSRAKTRTTGDTEVCQDG